MGDTRFLFNGLINERKSRPRKKLRSRTTFHPLVSPLASLLPFPFFSILFLFFPFLFSLSLFFFAQPLLLMNPRPSPNLPPLLLLTFFHRSPYAVFDRNYFHLPIQLSIHPSICPAIETKNEIGREREIILIPTTVAREREWKSLKSDSTKVRSTARKLKER